jgi:uncharacterized membrane protein
MDKRTFLPKRNKWFGWTINFARPQAYLLILFIIVVPFLLAIISMLFG